MERLTEKIDDHYVAKQRRLSNGEYAGIQLCLDKLGKYEDMDEEAKEHKFLIDIPADGNCIYILGHRIPDFDDFEKFCDYLLNFQRLEKELQKYKDLEEQGLLLKLPCKIGDTLWWIDVYGDLKNSEVNSMFIEYGIDGIVIETLICNVNESEIGKTVFLTKEEAEAALEKQKEGLK